MLWAACCHFFSLPEFRGDDCTVSSFDWGRNLTPMDVAVDNLQQPLLIQLALKGSKTNQTCQGVKCS